MRRDFDGLARDTFDLIVIGGGIVGTGIARDAALRGLHTLLVEKEDFAYGTTSRSSRLIHGGLRYLPMLNFKLVREDLREREILLTIAPHLVRELRFIIPLVRSAPFNRLALPVGLFLYDILAKGKSLPSRQHLSRRETLAKEPCMSAIDGLVGSYVYSDCQTEFMERLCLENAIDAAGRGALVVNHALATGLRKDGGVSAVQVTDTLCGDEYQAHGRIVLNAGGPWADLVCDRLNVDGTGSLRKTKGIHLLTRKLSENALALSARSDGRLFFVIPWQDYSWIGTTDTDFDGDLDSVFAEAADVDYLASELSEYFPDFKKDDIFHTTAGLRALVTAGGKSASETSRAHRLVDHESRDDIKGLVSVLGGKITAYRHIAEEAVNLVCRKLHLQAPCSTADTPLPGAPSVQTRTLQEAARAAGLSVETVAHLARLYGSRFSSVLEYARSDGRLARPIFTGGPDVLAQVKHAVDNEEAMTVSDFLLRRSAIGLGPSQGLDAVETVAGEMASLLGWSSTVRQNQIDSYRTVAALGHRFTK